MSKEKSYDEIRADFHLHLYTSWLARNLERGPRDIATLTRAFKQKGLDIATITNFLDSRWERFISTIIDLPKGWEAYESKRGIEVYMPDGQKVYWIKSQEIPTQQGHILFWGLETNKYIESFQPLETTLNKANKDLTSVIADHAMAILPKTPLSIGKENLLRFGQYITAAELNAGIKLFFPNANKEIEEICSKERKPLTANSDNYCSTTPFIGSVDYFKDIGETYNSFKKGSLNFASIDELLYSIKGNIESQNFDKILKDNSHSSILQHFLFAYGYSYLKKLGYNIQHDKII